MSDKPTSINLGTSRSLLQESGSSFSVFKMANLSIDHHRNTSSQSHAVNNDNNDDGNKDNNLDTTTDTDTSWMSNNALTTNSNHPITRETNTQRGDECSDNVSTNNVLSSINTNDSLLRILSAKRAEVEATVIQLVERGDVKEFMALYSEHQYRIDLFHMKGMKGFSPLHYACQRGHFTMVSLLLRICPALLHLNNMNGETALHLSVYSGQLLLIEQLIDKASTGDKGNGFVDASGVVEPNSKAGNNDGGGHIRNKFIDAQTNDGETALMLAASRNQPAIVRMLLSHHARTDIRDKYDDSVWEYGEDHATILDALRMVSKDKENENDHNASHQEDSLGVEEVEHVFSYLTATEVCKCAMVCTKWHRVSESDTIWTNLGTRRWELALQASLGVAGGDFAGSATSMFQRPSSKGKKGKKCVK